MAHSQLLDVQSHTFAGAIVKPRPKTTRMFGTNFPVSTSAFSIVGWGTMFGPPKLSLNCLGKDTADTRLCPTQEAILRRHP